MLVFNRSLALFLFKLIFFPSKADKNIDFCKFIPEGILDFKVHFVHPVDQEKDVDQNHDDKEK